MKTKRGSVHELLTEFINEDIKKSSLGTTFLQHLFTAQWQSLQFQNLKNKIPEDVVLQVMDFAKNREVKYQNEIKSAFCSNQQITMHPIVSFY